MPNQDDRRRRLAAILAADVAGYSRLMGQDENSTITALNACRAIFRDRIESHRGRVVDTAGDSVLAVFDSVVEAVQCANEVQAELGTRNQDLPDDRRMLFRIGVNLGDVIEQDDGTIYGDGVNVAARLENLAEPGGICLSGSAHEQVEGKTDLGFQDIGEHKVKNIAKSVRAYQVLTDGSAATIPSSTSVISGKRAGLIAAASVVVLIAGFGAWWLTREPPPPPMVTAAGIPTDDPVLAMPTGPSIAVLPFDNLSGDPEQDYFVIGLTEELIAGLARFQNIQVIARNSSSQYEGKAVDVRDVGRDLGVAYVLEGSVRRDRNTVRITAQLIDAGNGTHLWAETYERDLSAAGVFAVQDEITAQVASIIAGHSGVIARQLVGAAAGRRTDDLAAFECVLLAYKYDRVFSQDNYLAARSCLENAIERDPDYAEALGALSYIYADGYQMGLAEEDSSIDFLAEAYRLAFRAVELDPTSAGVQRQLAMAYFYNGELDGFHEHAERALTLNPHDPTTLGQLGTFMGFTGDYARAGPLVRKAFALNSELPYWFKFTFAGEHYLNGEWEAGRVLMEGLDTSDDNPHTHTWHLLFLGELALKDRATEVLARLRSITPNFSIAEFRTDWANWNVPAENIERYAASLRKAGVLEAPPKPARPVIAVLPFTNMSGDPEQEYFADGITEEIITELTRFGGLAVISRNSTFQYKGRAVDVREVGRELGARYVVEGSVRKAADRIRVTAQVLDAASGAHLWAETYERGLTAANIFAVQDEITQKIVATIADTYGVIARAGLEEVKRKRTENLEVYDCILRDNEFRRTDSSEAHLVARTCLERAIELDPDYAEAWARLSHAYAMEYAQGYNPRPSLYDALERCNEAAQRAVDLDPANEVARLALARAHFFRQELDLFLVAAERAVELNDNNADVIGTIGLYMVKAGEWERGLALIERAMMLNPKYPDWWHFPFVDSHYHKREYEQALSRLHQINMPGYWWTHLAYAYVYGQLGRDEEARDAAAKLRELYPEFTAHAWEELRKWYYSEAVIQHIIEGLRKAGLDIPNEPAAAD